MKDLEDLKEVIAKTSCFNLATFYSEVFEFFQCQIKHHFVFKTMQKAHLKFHHQGKALFHTCVMTSSEDINDKSSCYSNAKNQTGQYDHTDLTRSLVLSPQIVMPTY